MQWSLRLGWIAILTLLGAGAGFAQTAPTGAYGFVMNATFTDTASEGGVALVGLAHFDGAGNVSGPFDLETGSGGAGLKESVQGTFAGTYTTDGSTGTLSVTFNNGTADFLTVSLEMIIDNGGHDLQFVVTGCSPDCDFSKTVMTGVGQAAANGFSPKPKNNKSAASLTGTYGSQFTKSSPSPASALTAWTFDGLGGVSAAIFFVSPGVSPSVSTGTFSGTYTVNSDGTGTITLAPQGAQKSPQTFAFVITHNGSGILMLQTNRAGDGVFYGIAELQ